MIDVVEETLDIQVNHPVKLPASLPRLPHCIQSRLPRPVAVRIRMEQRIYHRSRPRLHPHLRDPIQLESPPAFPRRLPSVSSPSAPAAESSCPTTSDSRSYTGSFSGSSQNP